MAARVYLTRAFLTLLAQARLPRQIPPEEIERARPWWSGTIYVGLESQALDKTFMMGDLGRALGDYLGGVNVFEYASVHPVKGFWRGAPEESAEIEIEYRKGDEIDVAGTKTSIQTPESFQDILVETAKGVGDELGQLDLLVIVDAPPLPKQRFLVTRPSLDVGYEVRV